MSAIFISYRREDAEDSARALYESLIREFGKERLFMDVEAISLGSDFREAVERSLDNCGVFLAIIGPGWLGAKSPNDPSGRRRLDDPADFVRQEVATALKRGSDASDSRKRIPVIPVLVRGAIMPSADSLPDDLKNLAYRNALTLSHLDWDGNVQKLVAAIRPHVGEGESARPAAAVGAEGTAARIAAVAAKAQSAPEAPRPTGGMNRAVLIGIPLLIVAAIVGYFVLRPTPKPYNPKDNSGAIQPSATDERGAGGKGRVPTEVASARSQEPSAGKQTGSAGTVPSGLPVLIVRNSRLTDGPGPVNVLIDGKRQGQISFNNQGSSPLEIHTSEGQHSFTFENPQTGASCSGNFTVSSTQPKLVPRMRAGGTICSLEPFNKGQE